MTERRTNTMKVGTKIGAGLGVLAFLVFGIVPGFYFGSYGTLVLLSHLAGGPVGPTTIVRMLTVVGIMLGIFCVGAVSIVQRVDANGVLDLLRAPVVEHH